MIVKVLGAILVVLGCGSVGFMKVAAHKREETALRQLINALDFMEWELQYRQTPLPQLCRSAGENIEGGVQSVLCELSEELEQQIAPDAQTCMEVALLKFPELPKLLKENFRQLGCSLGRFDLSGQIQGIEAVRDRTQQNLKQHCQNKDARLRCYQALGLCAGSALVVLFL